VFEVHYIFFKQLHSSLETEGKGVTSTSN